MDLENIKTVSDVIFNGISVTVLGLVVVFAVLIIIMLFIYAMAFFSKDKKAAEKTAEIVSAPEPDEEKTDEGELIAVITAAVAACMGQSAATVKIKSYKKVSNNWQNASKREVLNRY